MVGTALVTGGSGFIGFNLVNRLLEDGWKVYFTGRTNEQWRRPPDPAECVGTSFSEITFRDLAPVDVVFHQAAITDTTEYDEEKMYRVNLRDSMKLFQDAFGHGCAKFVYASSCAVYGDTEPPFKEDGFCNPLNVYGRSKLLLDEHAMIWGNHNKVDVVGLRYSNVYGPFESHKGKCACMVTRIGNQMITGNPKLFKWGEQRRDFVYVKDIVDYNLAAAEFNGQNVFNAGSGTDTSFLEVVEIFNDHLNLKRSPEFVDNPYDDKYQSMTLCDMKKTKEKLGTSPKWSIKEAVKDYFNPCVI
jgi:ADP-L-glycero-D-manno-heptose 6-epimerase